MTTIDREDILPCPLECQETPLEVYTKTGGKVQYVYCGCCGLEAEMWVWQNLPRALPTNNDEVERLWEALTPSAETKAAYWGEFSFSIPSVTEDGDEATETVAVPWTTIKEIMAAIHARALIQPNS